MSLKLIRPGDRGNRYWLVRGTVGGRRIEVSSQTGDKAAAARFAAQLEARLLEDRLPANPLDVTFRQAADRWIAWKDAGEIDRRRIDRLCLKLGTKRVSEIVHADLVETARALYPDRKPATLNREAMAPAATVLHYAASNGWCPWLRVALFRAPRPVTRATDMETAAILLAAAKDPDKELLLLWLFKMGDRISDVLAIRWDQIDLTRRTVTHVQGKTSRQRTAALDDELWEVLANWPAETRTGRLFPRWARRESVYNWLRPLAASCGVKFTPHMARHSVGTWMAAHGESLRAIMGKLGHADAKSSIRYQAEDIEVIRAATKKWGNLRGRDTTKAQKA